MIALSRTANNDRIRAYRVAINGSTCYDVVVSATGVEIYRVSRSKNPACRVFDTITQARDSYKGAMRKGLAALEDYAAAGESAPLIIQ